MNQSKVLIYKKNEKHRAFFLRKLKISYFNRLIFNALTVSFFTNCCIYNQLYSYIVSIHKNAG